MAFFKKGAGDQADNLKQAEHYLGEAERYAKPSKNQNLQSAGESYRTAVKFLEAGMQELETPKDRERYERLQRRAGGAAQLIVESASNRVIMYLADAKECLERGDQFSVNMAIIAGSKEPDEYMREWYAKHPEAAKMEESERAGLDERVRSHVPGYSIAANKIKKAEQDIAEAEKVSAVSGIGDFQSSLQLMRGMAKKVKDELESRGEK